LLRNHARRHLGAAASQPAHGHLLNLGFPLRPLLHRSLALRFGNLPAFHIGIPASLPNGL
jgi:hypothetical protein